VKTQVLLRKIHHWGSLLIMLQMGLVIAAGLLLMVKKEFTWIQPPTMKSVEPSLIPSRSMAELFAAAQALPQLELNAWQDLVRVDVKPDKGVVKFVASNQWEAQFDTTSGELLHLAYRRSDIIESLHDGSFFADWVKLYVFLPSGLVLLVLWATGIYLFFLTQLKRRRKLSRLARGTSYLGQSQT